MESISCKCPFLPTLSHRIKHPSPTQKTQLVLPLTRGRSALLNPIHSPLQLRTVTVAINSITPPSIDAINSPATSGDISVLIPISILLLFVYWIANFVVPSIISKDFSPERPNEEIPEEPIAPLGTSMPGRSKKRE